MRQKGRVFIFSSPSGGGKSSLIKALMQEMPHFYLSVSVTTRDKRIGEFDGIDYNFITLKQYNTLREQGGFLESARVYDYYYATPKEAVFAKLDQGIDVIFDIDWQGARSIRQIKQYHVVSIFILPPSLDELYKRLVMRGDEIAIIERRMLKAQEECLHANEYDYALINNNFASCLEDIKAIITAEKLRIFNKELEPQIKDILA